MSYYQHIEIIQMLAEGCIRRIYSDIKDVQVCRDSRTGEAGFWVTRSDGGVITYHSFYNLAKDYPQQFGAAYISLMDNQDPSVKYKAWLMFSDEAMRFMDLGTLANKLSDRLSDLEIASEYSEDGGLNRLLEAREV